MSKGIHLGSTICLLRLRVHLMENRKFFPSIIPVHESAGEQKTALLEGLREMIVGEDGIFKALAKDIENAGKYRRKTYYF